MRSKSISPILAFICLTALSILPLAAQDTQVDPFYQSRLDEGKALYLQGRYAGALESLNIASFGFLDIPSKLLECHVYSLLCQYGLKNEERCAFQRSEIRRLNLIDLVPSLNLPPAVKAKYDEIEAAFARVESRASRQIPSAKQRKEEKPPAQTPPPSTKPVPPAPAKDPAKTPAKIDVQSAGALVLQARAESRLSKKIDLYKQALDSDPSDINIYLEMNDVYYAARKYRDASDLMELLLLYYPNDLRIHIRLAEASLADKVYEKAYRSLVQAARLDPGNIEVRYLLARADMGLRRYKEALAELDAVLRLDPGFRDAASLREACLAKIRQSS